ncbi:exodeoxyribonuclease VII large subunit, partial [Alteromonas mediterranea]|uniref:exodeoxyribonuclease VII large subunit n=1 Tax=Alteromonas mediterranea TaxID=314275 RepID=UPI00241D7EC9
KRRSPQTEVIVYPSMVQGEAAPLQLINALRKSNQRSEVDVLLLTRGGGSLEDLWCFNDESLAREIAASTLPIVSAVGHEVDFTISDFVADVRSPTPSAAAEILSQDSTALYQTINQQKQRLARAMNHCIQANKQQLTLKKQRLDALHPQSRIQSQWQTLDRLQLRLVHAMQRDMSTAEKRVHALNYRLNQQSPAARVARAKDKLSYANAKLIATMTALLKNKKSELGGSVTLLQSVSPLSTLARGYSITLTDSTTVNNVSKVNVGDEIKTRVTDGEITSTVTNIQRQ